MIYYIRRDFLTFGNHFTILDEFKQDAFYVEKQLFTWGGQFSLTADTGKELAYIKQETILFPTFTILKDGSPFATVTKEFSWLGQKFTLDVPGPNDYEISGSFWLGEYEFRRKDSVVATVSKQHFSIPQHYGVNIAKDEDVVSILATCIVIEQILQD